jgi:hypothetical protein
MKQTFFALVITLMGFSATAQNTNKLVNDYIAVKNALVNGDGKTASEAITAFHQSVKEEGSFAQKDALVKATDELAKAGSLDKQRAAFNEVSTNLWKMVKSAGKIETPLYYQYCPMKKAYWVSKEKDVKNPYYGSAMLTCGKVVETN